MGQVRSFGQWLGFRAWLDDLHRNLHLGVVGRHYSELAASWLWVVALGGLALWLGKRRREKRARRLLVPDLAATGRSRTMSWHAVVGVWILLGVLALSVSGLTWSRYAGANIGEIRTALSWTTPSPSPSLHDGADSTGHEHHGAGTATSSRQDAVFKDGVGIDGVYATAREAGLGDPLYLVPPADEMSGWTAGENKRSWPTSYDTITVDPATGHVVDRVDFADWPFIAKMTDWVSGPIWGSSSESRTSWCWPPWRSA